LFGDLSYQTGKGPEALPSATSGRERERDISSRKPHISNLNGIANSNSSKTHSIEAAFADSAYTSAPYPDSFLIVDKVGASRPGFSGSKTEKTADDTGTVYPLATTTVMQDLAHLCISEITKDIQSKLGIQVDNNIWESLSETVPELIKSFAAKLGLSASNGRDRRIRYFVHKLHQ
jgi:hypothetical protein